MKSIERIVETLHLENGFEIDLDEGWNKLTTSQFGGSPGRAFSELIQNAIDSYPAGTLWKDRKGEIKTTGFSISITDWGEGFDSRRLELLATVGGTDKAGDESKIGRFGLGFISIFNPRLKTTRVVVVTKCEGHVVEMIFTVTDPFRRPRISLNILNTKTDFSTCITVEFSDSYSVEQCLESAKKSLSWYPCPMTIDGVLYLSAWQTGRSGRFLSFSEGNCEGLIRKGTRWHNVNILCKYELVTNVTLPHFINGGHNMKYNLADYEANKTPFIPDVEIVYNINNLRLVISRDNYYLDWNYERAKILLNLKLQEFLSAELEENPLPRTVIGNHYIFGNELNGYINDRHNKAFNKDENRYLKLLAEIPVYRINGRPGQYSLLQLKKMLRSGVPLWYSPEQTNLRWLGGSFKHDYILIPEHMNYFSNSSDLYDKIFEAVFKDVVNLDRVISDPDKIQELVDRGLVDKSALSPHCEILGMRDLTTNQQDTISELNRLLDDKEIQEIIGSNLHIPVRSIKPVFFSVSNEGTWLSTGIFDYEGRPVSEEYVSNIIGSPEDQGIPGKKDSKLDLLLGLNLDHPFICFLVESTSRFREYFTLTYLAHELALCQKMLVPYSPFYHLVRQKLAQDMRKALMKNLLARIKN